jgi:peptide/nickel transport system ATP-binding protein
MTLVGLNSAQLELRPRQLSGGQRQRVALARALALSPSILVADEPTSALDVSIQNQILDLLSDLRDRLGIAIVFITHNIQAIAYLADRLAIMYLGRKVEEGPTADLVGEPWHPYTRALLSASPTIASPMTREVLGGSIPSRHAPPPGCPFVTRCPHAAPICDERFPDARTGDAGRSAHCVLRAPTASTRP